MKKSDVKDFFDSLCNEGKLSRDIIWSIHADTMEFVQLLKQHKGLSVNQALKILSQVSKESVKHLIKPRKRRKSIRSSQIARENATWRWARTICPGCSVKGKHLRGYKSCDKNPDPDTYGFEKKMGRYP